MFHIPGSPVTPRRSPRIANTHMDAFLYTFLNDKCGTTAHIIHNLSRSITVQQLRETIVLQNNAQTVYTPRDGVYWLRKGNKQPVALNTDMDLEMCKQEYSGTKSIRIACAAVLQKSTSGICYKLIGFQLYLLYISNLVDKQGC